MNDVQTLEMISAVADGQLQGDDFATAVQAAVSDPASRDAWHTYHLIGEVLRSGEGAAFCGAAPEAFVSKLQVRLKQEQPLSALQAQARVIGPTQWKPAAQPANDSNFRWKMVAGFASLAAVAAVGWTVVTGLPAPSDKGQLASAQNSAVLAASERGVMIRDPRLDEFLAAHRQLGGPSAVQMPAGFLRNATFESASR